MHPAAQAAGRVEDPVAAGLQHVVPGSGSNAACSSRHQSDRQARTRTQHIVAQLDLRAESGPCVMKGQQIFSVDFDIQLWGACMYSTWRPVKGNE